VASDQVTDVLIRDCQRIAVDCVARPEVTVVVRSPEIVRRLGVNGHNSWVLNGPSTAAFPDEAFSREQIADGTRCRPIAHLTVPRPQPVEQLDGPPRRVRSSRSTEQGGHVITDAVRTDVRSVTSVPKAGHALFIKPLEPLVAGLPADAVAVTQLRHCVECTLVIGDKSLTLFHGCRLQPGHFHLFHGLP
jgi:hypothetical protein